MKKLILYSIFLSSNVQAGLLFTSNILASKDYDGMNKIVQEKIVEAQKARGDRFVPLKEALQTVLCRPNSDGLLEKLLPPVKGELVRMNAWERSINSLTTEAIGALSNPKGFKPKVQNSYYIFLENLMSELKPKAEEKFEKSIFERIKNSKILITPELKRERSLQMMKDTPDLKQIALEVLTPPPVVAPPSQPAEPTAAPPSK